MHKTPEYKREAQRRYQAKRRLDPEWQAKTREYQKEYRKKNAERIAEVNRKWQQNNSLEIRLKRKGLTLEHIEQIKSHTGVCDICGNPPDGKWEELAIDHCHKEGGFRGLLCSSCNMGIGLFKDNPDNLRKAAQYIEDHRKQIEHRFK